MKKSPLPQRYHERVRAYGLSEVSLSDARLVSCEAGEWFLREGGTIDAVYFLLSGKLQVCMDAANGRSLLLCDYVSSGMIGDIELMLKTETALTSLRAVTPILLACLPRKVYEPILLACPPFVLCACKELANKLDARSRSSAEAILHPLKSRLCGYIQQTARNGMFVEPLTAVSDRLGCSYRHLLRCLKDLADDGVLEKAARGYRVVSESALSKQVRT